MSVTNPGNIGASNNISIEVGLTQAEIFLSKAARIPVVGTIPAIAKIALGLFQTIAAASMILVIGLPACLGRSTFWLNRSVLHVKHGLVNIGMGVFEAIPFMGTLSYRLRETEKELHDSPDNPKNCKPLVFIDALLVDPMSLYPYEPISEKSWHVLTNLKVTASNPVTIKEVMVKGINEMLTTARQAGHTSFIHTQYQRMRAIEKMKEVSPTRVFDLYQQMKREWEDLRLGRT